MAWANKAVFHLYRSLIRSKNIVDSETAINIENRIQTLTTDILL